MQSGDVFGMRKPDVILCVIQMWIRHTSRCILVEFDVGYEESVCVVTSPAAIHSTVASEKCRAYMTQLSCYKDPDCDWCTPLFGVLTFRPLFRDQDDLMCRDNGFAFYFGVSMEDIFKAAEGVRLTCYF